MKNFIVEYKTYWFDCDVEWEEQTLNIKAETKDKAIKIGKEKIKEMDDMDNKYCDEMYPMVGRTFYRCVEEQNHVFNSSVKEPSLGGFQGYKDTIKWNGL